VQPPIVGQRSIYADPYPSTRWMAWARRMVSVPASDRAKYDLGNRRTKTEAKTKLREAQQARDADLPAGRRDNTVRQAVESWLDHGLAGRAGMPQIVET
jgi:hypothetical protein